jgi:hypothetical protein
LRGLIPDERLWTTFPKQRDRSGRQSYDWKNGSTSLRTITLGTRHPQYLLLVLFKTLEILICYLACRLTMRVVACNAAPHPAQSFLSLPYPIHGRPHYLVTDTPSGTFSISYRIYPSYSTFYTYRKFIISVSHAMRHYCGPRIPTYILVPVCTLACVCAPFIISYNITRLSCKWGKQRCGEWFDKWRKDVMKRRRGKRKIHNKLKR